MNLADLEKTFWGDQREQPTRVRLARVVRALREDIIPDRMRITRANDTCSRASLRRYFNEILGGLDAEGEAAGGPTREDGLNGDAAVTAEPEAATPAAPAPDVCEWKQLGDRHGQFLRECSKYPTESAAGDYCANCGKPISFKTEAQR